MVRPLACLALVLATSSDVACGCRNGTDHFYVVDSYACEGQISAPASAGLPFGFPADCGANPSDPVSGVGSSCLMTPDGCSTYTFGDDSFMASSQLDLTFTLGAPTDTATLTLPDPRAKVSATIESAAGQEPLTLTSGTLSATLTQNHLDVRFTLTLARATGGEVSVTNGRYQISGHAAEQCHAD